MPVFSEHQVNLHYNKHSAAYTKSFNKLIDELDEARANSDFNKYVELSKLLKFNGGGHINHELWWQSLAPAHSTVPSSESNLTKLVLFQWGSYENMINYFNTLSNKFMGSGWAWLVYNKATKALEYRQTDVHDVVSDIETELVPLLILDLWEHAFYVDYENRRGDYLSSVWKLVNWPVVESRLATYVQ